MRPLLLGLVIASVGLGMLLTTVLDNWIRGNSYMWLLSLSFLMGTAIAAIGTTLMTRLR